MLSNNVSSSDCKTSSKASIAEVKGLLKSGKIKKGVSVNFFQVLRCCSFDYMKGNFFDKRLVKRWTILTKIHLKRKTLLTWLWEV